MKILLAGSGDIAQRIPSKMTSQEQFFGLKRKPTNLPNGITPLMGDLTDIACLDRLFREGFDVVVATLTPDSATEEGYQRAYVDSAATLSLAIKNADHKPKLVIWASSTSVYGQSAGSWVDEDSSVKPASFSGRALLQAEQHIADLPCTTVVVRFSGIYGPGRTRMLDQVLAGVGQPAQPEQWSNRIHSEDCAGVLAHLIRLNEQKVPLSTLYLATDCEPVTQYELGGWLAAHLDVSLVEDHTKHRSSRRCSNKKLLDSGYRFMFPTYREGYLALIEQLKE
ncbi:MAG: sugar nucleotide-binding protein [Porticoccaceae bacterium]|nr:sugar nucleotide-binding protein [Porticoccaceae bacterium]MBT3798354.1 sugar nucleotide-binding protein [Porticoccaceae bacterium]MBT5003506.1 sugar nucleotide-binding protein [Porticoccaceae bacterium]MBT7167926.1 sugar nucleotide-binding protein [Porticoccaceae bacterium]MBT7566607.1 sugar nucleotide-binding protein [Porticoccaceae bacterium]